MTIVAFVMLNVAQRRMGLLTKRIALFSFTATFSLNCSKIKCFRCKEKWTENFWYFYLNSCQSWNHLHFFLVQVGKSSHIHLFLFDFAFFFKKSALCHDLTYFLIVTYDHRSPGNQNKNLKCKQTHCLLLLCVLAQHKNKQFFLHSAHCLQPQWAFDAAEMLRPWMQYLLPPPPPSQRRSELAGVNLVSKSGLLKPFRGVCCWLLSSSVTQQQQVHCWLFHHLAALWPDKWLDNY